MEKTHVEQFLRTVGSWTLTIEHWEELDSTNDRARAAAQAASSPVLVTAQHQRAGRGRRGRTWLDQPSAAVLMTIALPPTREMPLPPFLLMAASAIVVLDVIAEFIPRELLRLKYPNDLWLQPPGLPSGKVGGILVETDFAGSQQSIACVGIGINVRSVPRLTEASYPVRCLAEVAHAELPSPPLLAECIAEQFLETLLTVPHQHVMERWHQELRLVGRTVVLRSTQERVEIAGFTPDGGLYAVTSSGQRCILRDGDSLMYDPFSL